MTKTKSQILKKLIDYYSDGNKSDFARKLGVTPQGINTWLIRDTFDTELIYSKCEDISGDWLLSGEGSMLKKNSENFTEKNVPPIRPSKNVPPITDLSPPFCPPKQKGTRNWSPEIDCEFSEEEISDQQQIASLNMLVEGLQKECARKDKELAAKDALIKAQEQSIATQINALKLLEGQINASTNLLEQLAVFLGGESKKRPDSGDARTASDVTVSG